jgi:hypothetical protein
MRCKDYLASETGLSVQRACTQLADKPCSLLMKRKRRFWRRLIFFSFQAAPNARESQTYLKSAFPH